jgi:tetratricopeptide (TPR) repeat protein
MKTQLAVLAVSCAAIHCAAQTGTLSDWQKLLTDKKDPEAARALCTSFEQSKVLTEQVEAEKCLSNVAMWGADRVSLEKKDNGQVVMFDEYDPESVDESLKHLNRGLQLAPQDLTIHEGRLHVLEISRRYDEMVKALEESCTVYKGSDALDAWLNYSPELMQRDQFETGLAFMRVLDKHYPNDPDVIGNIGAFLSLLKRDADAIEYLKRAVDLAPKDPINAWDLGREYDYAGQIALANQWYQKALALDSDTERRKHDVCVYAEFIEQKLKDRTRACAMEKDNCSADQQTACAAPVSSSPSSSKNQ